MTPRKPLPPLKTVCDHKGGAEYHCSECCPGGGCPVHLNMTKGPATARERDVLVFLEEHIHIVGWAPTIRETAANFGWRSFHSASIHINNLARKGYIRQGKASASRAIAIEPKGILLLRQIRETTT